MEEIYYTVAEVAVLENVETVTVYRWIKGGLETKREHMSGLRYRKMIGHDDLREWVDGAKNDKA